MDSLKTCMPPWGGALHPACHRMCVMRVLAISHLVSRHLQRQTERILFLVIIAAAVPFETIRECWHIIFIQNVIFSKAKRPHQVVLLPKQAQFNNASLSKLLKKILYQPTERPFQMVSSRKLLMKPPPVHMNEVRYKIIEKHLLVVRAETVTEIAEACSVAIWIKNLGQM